MSADKIIVKPEILSEGFVPETIHGRSEHLAQLRNCLAPALKGRKPLHALLTGPTGSGKTAVGKAALSMLRESKVPIAFVNCRLNNSFYAILDQVVAQLGILRAEKIDTGFKIKAVEEYLEGRPAVIVLNEIDTLTPKERNSVLYNLTGIGNIGLVCICEDAHFLHSLEEEAKSRLYPTHIEFQPYEHQDMAQIIRDRCTAALAEGAVEQKHIDFIAAQSEGNIRIALEILRKAASFAEQDGKQRLSVKHLKLASLAANGSKRDYLLSQNEHYRIIYEIVQKNSPEGIMSGHLWKAYTDFCYQESKQPVANRTFLLYLKKLQYLSLVMAERAGIRGNVRRWRVRE
ncbi:MAG: AAA family ATPase [Acidobacteria bacterium]|nr:AAA family ATPase [Acidobacteriota bacterium]